MVDVPRENNQPSVMLYQVHLTMFRNRTHNVSDGRHRFKSRCKYHYHAIIPTKIP